GATLACHLGKLNAIAQGSLGGTEPTKKSLSREAILRHEVFDVITHTCGQSKWRPVECGQSSNRIERVTYNDAVPLGHTSYKPRRLGQYFPIHCNLSGSVRGANIVA
ncbi:MAG: hypothetical protein ACXW6R_27165, partial [Candidatus Binatia bacterium]